MGFLGLRLGLGLNLSAFIIFFKLHNNNINDEQASKS